jgi:hypothetical protein
MLRKDMARITIVQNARLAGARVLSGGGRNLYRTDSAVARLSLSDGGQSEILT